nr:MAG TPA: hypothetical protein [Caudoviricetes sp.]
MLIPNASHNLQTEKPFFLISYSSLSLSITCSPPFCVV